MPSNINYWLAIGATDILGAQPGSCTFWCLPSTATSEDRVYMYVPRGQCGRRHGICGLCSIKAPPKGNHKLEHICRPYTAYGKKLMYTELVVQHVYTNPLTAKMMKYDFQLSQANFVRRNFQGTLFPLSKSHAMHIDRLVHKVNQTDSEFK